MSRFVFVCTPPVHISFYGFAWLCAMPVLGDLFFLLPKRSCKNERAAWTRLTLLERGITHQLATRYPHIQLRVILILCKTTDSTAHHRRNSQGALATAKSTCICRVRFAETTRRWCAAAPVPVCGRSALRCVETGCSRRRSSPWCRGASRESERPPTGSNTTAWPLPSTLANWSHAPSERVKHPGLTATASVRLCSVYLGRCSNLL